MKISVICKDTISRKVNATKAFMMFGVQFYVHQQINEIGGGIMKTIWCVSEPATGLSVLKDAASKERAIKAARKRLKEKGEKEFIKACRVHIYNNR